MSALVLVIKKYSVVLIGITWSNHVIKSNGCQEKSLHTVLLGRILLSENKESNWVVLISEMTWSHIKSQVREPSSFWNAEYSNLKFKTGRFIIKMQKATSVSSPLSSIRTQIILRFHITVATFASLLFRGVLWGNKHWLSVLWLFGPPPCPQERPTYRGSHSTLGGKWGPHGGVEVDELGRPVVWHDGGAEMDREREESRRKVESYLKSSNMSLVCDTQLGD